MAKAPTRLPVIFQVAAAGKLDDLTGETMEVEETVAGVAGAAPVEVTDGQSVLLCEDSETTGIYTADADGWVRQTRQPRVNDLVYVTGGTLYEGMLLRHDGDGEYTPVGLGLATNLVDRIVVLED